MRAGPRRVLVLGGLDPTGGAGLSADGEALDAVGARLAPVATALTVQGAGGAYGVEAVPLPLVRAQVEGLLAGRGVPLAAAKTGMLATAAIAAEAARLLALPRLRRLPLVVDPVLAASSGLPLLEGGGVPVREALSGLLERATVVTPNLPELALLSGIDAADLGGEAELIAAARALGCAAVLVKGGHRLGPPVDLLVTGRAVRRYPGRRRRGTRRGTGCRLASAIAGLLAQGAPLVGAVAGAKEMVERYLDEG